MIPQEDDAPQNGSLAAAMLGVVKAMVGPAILYLPHGFATQLNSSTYHPSKTNGSAGRKSPDTVSQALEIFCRSAISCFQHNHVGGGGGKTNFLLEQNVLSSLLVCGLALVGYLLYDGPFGQCREPHGIPLGISSCLCRSTPPSQSIGIIQIILPSESTSSTTKNLQLCRIWMWLVGHGGRLPLYPRHMELDRLKAFDNDSTVNCM
eukprot:scaffold29718_cov52-Attheya_sp.AAC.3